MKRQDTIRKALINENLDALLVTDVKNTYYLTGFLDISTATLNLLVPKEGECRLLVTPLSQFAAISQARDCIVKTTDSYEPMTNKLLEELKAMNMKRVGYDSLHLQTYLALKDAGVNLFRKTEIVANQRRVKDDDEISLIRRASDFTDAGMEAALEAIKAGVKENQVAGQAEFAMRIRGSMGVAFETIVASGPRSAFPHGISTDREIGDGDLVTVDIGATWRGYCSDLTRTVVAGKASNKDLELLRAVREAHDAVLKELRPGVEGSKIDAVARAVLGPSLVGYFIHGLGHGVGLEVHEGPTLSRNSNDILESGNVITDEPGVYIRGYGGVRTEDTILVTSRGYEKLTNASYSPN